MKETKIVLPPHKAGVSLGALFALMHALWSVLFAGGMGAGMHEYMMRTHFVTTQYMYAPFNLFSGIIGIVLAAVVGYVIGYAFAWIWNKAPE